MTTQDRTRLEDSVEEMLDAVEIQDPLLYAAAKAQMIKDCHMHVTEGHDTVDELVEKNLHVARKTRALKMGGADVEAILTEVARQDGVYEKKDT